MHVKGQSFCENMQSAFSRAKQYDKAHTGSLWGLEFTCSHTINLLETRVAGHVELDLPRVSAHAVLHPLNLYVQNRSFYTHVSKAAL